MGRIILTLAAACLVGTFVMLARMPFDTGRTSGAAKKEPEAVQPEKETSSKKNPRPQQTAGRRKGDRSAASRKADAAVAQAGDQKSVAGSTAAESDEDSSQTNVTKDSAVHSVNSSKSPVVKLLRKGDKVETDIEVIDSEGRWSLVKDSTKNKPGYVRSDSLEKKQPAKRTGQ